MHGQSEQGKYRMPLPTCLGYESTGFLWLPLRIAPAILAAATVLFVLSRHSSNTKVPRVGHMGMLDT